MRIEIDIEELVLYGFDPRDRHAVGDAVQRELARLFGERPPAAIGGLPSVAHLDAGAISISPNVRGGATGVPIARALHAALSEPGRK